MVNNEMCRSHQRERVINIVYDKKIKELLCPKCRDIADWDKNGDLQCSNELCKYTYYVFSDKDNSFQGELNFD